MLCNVLGCLHGSEDTRKNTFDSLSKNTSAGSIVCQLFTSIAGDGAKGGRGGSQRRSRVVGEQPCLDGASVGVTVSDWAWPEDVVGRSHR